MSSLGFELGTSSSDRHINQEHRSLKYRRTNLALDVRSTNFPATCQQVQQFKRLRPTNIQTPISLAQPFHLREEWPVSDLNIELSADRRNRSVSCCCTLPQSADTQLLSNGVTAGFHLGLHKARFTSAVCMLDGLK